MEDHCTLDIERVGNVREIAREVNIGQTFACLRQVFSIGGSHGGLPKSNESRTHSLESEGAAPPGHAR